jgi:SAM-dependent methyltransferase
MPVVAAVLFLSAFLLFICQPMAGKMLLPYLGGAPAVWTTCVLFFQFMLLLGYVYAHLLTRLGDLRKQMAAHAAVMFLPLLFLPIRFSAVSLEGMFARPIVQLLAALTASAAIPFFAVSTTAPLLQNWFSRSGHRFASDPYFLYSASNAGSLLALLAYPLAIEPWIGVAAQSRLWFAGYIALLGVFGLAVAAISKRGWKAVDCRRADRAAWRSRLNWVAASFVPSGLMLAVTNHIASNIGSVPFLWLVPLSIYLLTFILSFARRHRVSVPDRSFVIVLLIVFPLVAADVVAPPGLNWIIISAHLLLLYAGSLLCHTRLAASRPAPEQLTEFYFWIAFGGVLGGAFTATLAPAVFRTVLEYPLLVAALPFFRGGKFDRPGFWIAAGIAAAIIGSWMLFRRTGLDADTDAVALAHTVLVFIGYQLSKYPKRFASTFVVLMISYTLILPGYIEGANRIYAARNFFGVKKVLDDRATHLRKLVHGDTIHGIESTDPARSGEPLSYYYAGGSVSDVMEMLRGRGTPQRIGVLGLGAGTMAAFAGEGWHVTFYEIDASIEPIARTYFTFLRRCGSNCNVVIGDGRLQLAREPAGSLDLLLLDAFSSDSVPAHLVSREALKLYLNKLKPDGVLLFHVSNRYLNVEKLAAALVTDAGLVALSRFDDAGELRKLGKTSASHLVAARRLQQLEFLQGRPGWRPVVRPPDLEPWTDDYSNLFALIRWH